MLNQLKTTLLLASLTALLMWAGERLGGGAGLKMALMMAAFMNLGAYWFSDKIVLALYRAQPVGPNDALGMHAAVKKLSAIAGIPMPKLYLIDDHSPNAFATGRNPHHASVAATTGLIRMLSPEELEGVLAHELAHVVHRDTLISAIAATLAGALNSLAHWFFLLGGTHQSDEERPNPVASLFIMLMTPIAAGLIQMAISRSREFLADERGAKLCGNPLALARALEKLEHSKHQGVSSQMQAHPATAHLFIVNPLTDKGWSHWFSTHPSTEERIQRLKNMAT